MSIQLLVCLLLSFLFVIPIVPTLAFASSGEEDRESWCDLRPQPYTDSYPSKPIPISQV